MNPKARPTSYSYISPSITTYLDVLPSYRMYTVDGDYAGSTWAGSFTPRKRTN